jgi:hypothetical protein
MYPPIDEARMHWHLCSLRLHAREAVELSYKIHDESKSKFEIWNETKQLVMAALLIAIHCYDDEYEIADSDTPETLYQRLWRECYDYKCLDSEIADIVKETELIFDGHLNRMHELIDNICKYLTYKQQEVQK